MVTQKKEKPKHLGRGLQSLLGPITRDTSAPPASPTLGAMERNFPVDKELENSLQELAVDTISPNPYQPRAVWDQEELAELADSIRANGVIQPIIVRRARSGFELIAGERRFRAAKLAGLKVIPAIVRQATDEQLLEFALVENIQRTDLNPIERAKAYRSYLSTFSLTQAAAAEKLGESRSAIANYLRLLELPPEVQQMVIDGQLSMGHARAVLALPTDQLRRKLANRALSGRLSVREVERLVHKFTERQEPTGRQVSAKAPHIVDLERKLTAELGTKVRIDTRRNGQRGTITIEFYSLDEFDRITERIGVRTMEEV